MEGNNLKHPLRFLFLAVLALLFGSVAGLLASIQYLDPYYLKNVIPFSHMRELHVSSMVGWIVLAASGGIYYYLQTELQLQWRFPRLMAAHFWIFLIVAVLILTLLFLGRFGGREYMTFSPWLILPVVLGWVLMAFNYFKSVWGRIKPWPVYLWMWGTGLVFISYHLLEANLWLFDWFRLHFIRDLTVQWKSYGSVVGSWNMMVYGTAIFLMSKLKGPELAYTKTAFFFYFLGLSNLMLGWAHHIYPVPGEAWIRGLSYAISMTEWIVLASMLTNWIKSMKPEERLNNHPTYLYLVITDIWVFMNVFLALLISIPAINHYTHGTHITVAHSMGTTIGINTSILLASCLFIANKLNSSFKVRYKRWLWVGIILFNLSLLVFLTSLIGAGWTEGRMLHVEGRFHAEIMEATRIWKEVFHYAGGALVLAIFILAMPILRVFGAAVTGFGNKANAS